MRALSILALITIASPAFAETPADKQPLVKDQKPIIYDGPGLNSFSPPSPVIIGGATVAPLPSTGKAIPTPPAAPQVGPTLPKPGVS